MNGIFKVMLFVLLLIYFVSPIDLCPGPIDDLIAIVLGIGGTYLSTKLKDC